MKLRIIGFASILMIAALFTLFGVDCADDSNDDDDHNDATDDDDSDSGSCSQTINPGGGETTSISMNYSSTAIADCLPELPDQIYEEQLTILLEGYLGQYHSEIGTIRTISCRPEGEWVIPNYDAQDLWCGYSYEIPVWIELEENTEILSGTILYIFSMWESNVEKIFNSSEILMSITTGNYEYSAYSKINERITWEFHYYPNSPTSPPEDEREGFITWTKDEPFGE